MRLSPIGLRLVCRDCVQAGLPRLCRAEAGDEGGQGQCRALLDLRIPPACRRHAGGRIRRAGARKAAPCSCAWYLGRSEGGGAGRCAASGSPASTMVRETSCLTSRCKLPRLLVRPCPHWWLAGRGQRVLQAERYGGRGQDSVALPCFGQRVSRQAPANARELAVL